MAKRAQHTFPDLIYKVMDARKMTFDNGEFDVVIDKGKFPKNH
jgi:hypothetical protein